MKIILILCASLGLTVGSSIDQLEWSDYVDEMNRRLSNFMRSESRNHHNRSNVSWIFEGPKLGQYNKTLNESRRSQNGSYLGQFELVNLPNGTNVYLYKNARNLSAVSRNHHQTNGSWSPWVPKFDQWNKTSNESRRSNGSCSGQFKRVKRPNKTNVYLHNYLRNLSAGSRNHYNQTNVFRSTWKPSFDPVNESFRVLLESVPSKWANLTNDINKCLSNYVRVFGSENRNHHNRSNVSWNFEVPKFEHWNESLSESLQRFTKALDSERLTKKCGKYILRLSDVKNYLNALNDSLYKIHENVTSGVPRKETYFSKQFLADLWFLKSFSDHCSKDENGEAEENCFNLVQRRFEESKGLYSQREPLLAAAISGVVHSNRTELLSCGQTNLAVLQVLQLKDTVTNMEGCLKKNLEHVDFWNSKVLQTWLKLVDSVDELTKNISEVFCKKAVSLF